jgi:lycopene cyclase domain-containing protein
VISFAYLGALVLVIGCMALLDARFRLVLWRDPRRGAAVLAVGIVFFLVWDVIAIHHGFYVRGGSDGMTGVELAPELPLEEIFFITFLCYLTLVAHGLLRTLREVVARRAGAPGVVRR